MNKEYSTAKEIFGVDIEKPIIRDVYEYMTYLTALELSGRPLPPTHMIEQELNNRCEIAGSSGLNPRSSKDNSPVIARPITEVSFSDVLEAFKKSLQLYISGDIRIARSLCTFNVERLDQYKKLVYSLQKFLAISNELIERFANGIHAMFKDLLENIAILNLPDLDERIDRYIGNMIHSLITVQEEKGDKNGK